MEDFLKNIINSKGNYFSLTDKHNYLEKLT